MDKGTVVDFLILIFSTLQKKAGNSSSSEMIGSVSSLAEDG
jgi:hypothetical protein